MKFRFLMRITHLSCVFAFVIFFFAGCQKDHIREKTSSTNNGTDTSYTSGVFVVNEGNFNWANASVTFIDPINNKVYQDIYSDKNNGHKLGDVAESMSISNNKGYIVVNNSNKVEVVSATTFSSITSIDGFNEPRFILLYNGQKAYVSNLQKNISIIDLNTNKVVNNISVSGWTEGLASYGHYIFTTCLGDYNQPSSKRNPRILVINAEKDMIVDSIKTGIDPTGIVKDKKNKIWVLCTGGYDYTETPRLMRIDAEMRTVEKVFTLPSTGYPSRLTINNNGDTLYFLFNGVYQMPVSSEAVPSKPLISADGRNLYGLGIDPATGNIFVSDAKDYVQNGKVYQYNQNNGKCIHSYDAGRIPGSFCFTNSSR
ncbi:MAG: hypothetical protein Q8867_02675 [Bacteroidota bacterium]|nr:hypothetical protein [Bacteroidota bacterium]